MKKLTAFIILYSSLWILWTFVILCPGTQAQLYKPYGSYQWEDAQVLRLTYNELPNKGVGLYINDNDKLYLFYSEGVRDTMTGFVYEHRLFYITKEKGGEWSQPEEIETAVHIIGQNRKSAVGFDTKTGIIHIFYYPYPFYDTLYYTNSSIPNWEFLKIDSLNREQSERYVNVNMGFDSLGNVHLVWSQYYWSEGTGWVKFMYMNNSTGEWVKQQVSPPIWVGYSGTFTAILAVQRNGRAHITHGGTDWTLSYYVRNDSLNSENWVTDTLPKPPIYSFYSYSAVKIVADANGRIHLFTAGCVEEDCVWPGAVRHFYYYKQAEDSIWQGPELIPDTSFGVRVGIDQVLIDEEGIPYASYFFSSNEVYFTDRYFTDRQEGNWQVPYGLVGWHGQTPDSFMVDAFCFVLDSQGKGHGAFSAFNFAQGMLEDDSVEIYYLASSNSGVDAEEEDHKIFHYEIEKGEKVTLKIYDILGREVRSLVNGLQRPGVYRVIWDGRNNQGKEVTSGIYFYQLTVRQAHRPEQSRGKAGDYKETRKLVLIK